MFKKLLMKFKKKPLVLCIHGFGHRRCDEYNNFKLWGVKEFDFITFNIFDIKDGKDTNPNEWIHRCEVQMENLLKTKRDITIIGFSMGGVLASHLASKYKVQKVFLIAPAFEFITIKNILGAITQIFSNQSSHSKMSSAQISCFMEVVSKCKDSISLIDCPILIVHGDCDNVISSRSSINAYDKIHHQQKRLLILHKGVHQLMLDTHTNNEVYQLFKLFMNNRLITYQPQQANDSHIKNEDSN